MDYEKKYDDALQRARELHEAGNVLTKTQMEIVFHELRESENERIRKEIIHYILYDAKGVSEEQEHAWISYLEKQKEKPADAKSERVIKAARRVLNNWLYGDVSADVSGDFTELEYSIRKYDGEEKQKEQKPVEHWQHVGEVDLEKDKAIEILENYLKWAVSESEEECPYYWKEIADAIRIGIGAMKEQKPNIELLQKSWYTEGYNDREFNKEPKWIIKTGEGGPRYEENPKYGQHIEKQDYSGINDFERAVHRGFLCAGVVNVPVNIIKETAQDCLAQLKPAEWSEDIIRKAVKEVGLTQHQIDWFKTNVFPPKPEWSEEDEDMLNSCISSIEEAKENRYAYKETDGDTSYDHEIAWFKSLRNRVSKESLQPHWKPGEEQEEPEYYQHFDPDC